MPTNLALFNMVIQGDVRWSIIGIIIPIRLRITYRL